MLSTSGERNLSLEFSTGPKKRGGPSGSAARATSPAVIGATIEKLGAISAGLPRAGDAYILERG